MAKVSDCEESRVSRKAAASAVLGLLSLVALVFAGIPAILLGAFSLNDIKASAGLKTGRGLALAGIVLGSIGSSVVVVAIPSVFLYYRLQADRTTRQAADDEVRHEAECRRNLEQIGQALQRYVKKQGRYPRDGVYGFGSTSPLGWRVALLPELGAEHAALHERFHHDEPWDSPHNKTLSDSAPLVYRCPSASFDPPGKAVYSAVTGPGTVFPGDHEPNVKDGTRPTDITDDPSQTLVLVETRDAGVWSAMDLPFDLLRKRVDSLHHGGYHALFADGTVQLLPDSTPLSTLNAMATRAAGDAVPPVPKRPLRTPR